MPDQPSQGSKASRPYVGPFLRFQGGAGAPGQEDRWTGSVLFLTHVHSTDAAAAAHASYAAPAGPGDGVQPRGATGEQQLMAVPGAIEGREPPVLLLNDSRGPDSDGRQEQRLTPTPLDTCLGWTFWRFELELRLAEWQRPLQYHIATGGATTPTFTFWLPAVGQPMHWGYYSCNGTSEDVAADAPERADPTYLWRDLLQLHDAFPLHALVGGGDQLYNDPVWKCPSLKAWGAATDYEKKSKAAWTPEMEEQATAFYLNNYMDSFSIRDCGQALASIAQINQWDDHDIWDGYGSYARPIQESPVFKGLFTIARRFYLLFQHHTTDAFNRRKQEFLINDGSSFHFLKYLGPQVALLGIDMRSQRTKHRIMTEETYEMLNRVVLGMPHGPLHLVVMSGIPVIFPKVPGAETVLGCFGKLTRNIPAMENIARKTGLLDRFEQPEIMDDLVDGWVANEHTEERLQFIRMLQGWSTSRGLRVSIVSGDAHVGGVGRFYSRPKIKNPGDDPLFMCQIISSAIVNAPPPHPVTKMLMRTNFASNVDSRTREKLVRAFYPFHPRTDKLIAQRNWLDVTLLAPPFSAPTVPQDPQFGGLRFILRVENAHHRRGYADETYTIMVPRHPLAAAGAANMAVVSAAEPQGRRAEVALPVPVGGLPPQPLQLAMQGQERQYHSQDQPPRYVHAVPLSVSKPEEGEMAPAAVPGKGMGGGAMPRPGGFDANGLGPATPNTSVRI